jgi:hypothetical protein
MIRTFADRHTRDLQVKVRFVDGDAYGVDITDYH